MPFKLVVKSMSDTAGGEAFEQLYDREVIRIGRQESNEVMLHDRRRLVSGRHAEIRQKNGQFVLVDVGSKNGTQLNGERLTKGKEYPLAQEDKIGIGDFVIQFFPIEQVAETEQTGGAQVESTMYFSETPDQVEELFENLNRAYWENPELTSEERRARFAEVLRGAIRGSDEVGARRILDLAESRFPDPDYQQEKIKNMPPGATVVSSQEGAAQQAAYQGLMKIAGKYVKDAETLKSPEKVAEFVERIERVLSVMLESLADAVKGRKEFEEGFDVASTRIFAWKQNPIKIVEGERGLGAYLFDTKNTEPSDKVISNLEEAFTDLALHQMGLMAGFKEGLRGLLKRLDPVTLEAEARATPLKLGPIKIPPLRIGLFSGWAAWNRFRQRHRELTEEEVKTFETILAPHIAKGYLSIQKKKKVS
ncbi:MAG TPA: type VI secretion system-associated FHA domain protein TagH [Nitrospiria bacterium]|nr:type VI secretion system-associated FHA domain protein TagH [Nitrospiria bacterium]